ncbi:MAG: hypothetical protein IJM66_10740 [Muribaculaceae bacterium]|nr:hypothetical protein [Muribaculaceae bacterium]
MRLILISFIVYFFISCSDDGNKVEKIGISSVQMQDSVWICASSSAKRFHASDTCKGLSYCGSDIITLTREDAENTGRTYCHKCYER